MTHGANGRVPGGVPAEQAIADFIPDMALELPEFIKRRAKDFFAYSVEVLPIAAGGVGAATFAVQADSDFLAVAIQGTVRDPNAVGTVFANPPITFNIDDQGSGRNLFNRAVDWNSIIGDAERPGYLQYPKFFNRSSSVNWSFTNLDAANTYDIRVAFVGFKIFEWDT